MNKNELNSVIKFIETSRNKFSNYLSVFDVDSDWKMIDLPFENFQRRRGSNEKTLDAKNITSFAIVAYGRDFTSDVSTSKIEFYY